MYGELRKHQTSLIVINESKAEDFDKGLGEMKLGGIGSFLGIPFIIKVLFK